jgi:hypothetical protein
LYDSITSAEFIGFDHAVAFNANQISGITGSFSIHLYQFSLCFSLGSKDYGH